MFFEIDTSVKEEWSACIWVFFNIIRIGNCNGFIIWAYFSICDNLICIDITNLERSISNHQSIWNSNYSWISCFNIFSRQIIISVDSEGCPLLQVPVEISAFIIWYFNILDCINKFSRNWNLRSFSKSFIQTKYENSRQYNDQKWENTKLFLFVHHIHPSYKFKIVSKYNIK